MISKLGEKFSDLFRKNMPDAFVFALLLTLLIGGIALATLPIDFFELLDAWYKGFWMLLEFGMQMVLLIVTGYTIALSPYVSKQINRLTHFIKTPTQVYFFVTLFGLLASIISWGWVVVAAVLARTLAQKVKGIHYPFLIACAYFSNNSWSTGLSSSIPLLLNTDANYLIESNILQQTISTSITLGSVLNISIMLLYIIVTPLLMLALSPKSSDRHELIDFLDTSVQKEVTIKEEAEIQTLSSWALSDKLNNSFILVLIIGIFGAIYVVRHFVMKGFDLNLNIMIFIFILIGLLLHQSPIRFGIAMRKTSSNISSILFQFPFYAGIMGIMINTGLGENLAASLSKIATVDSYPFFAFLLGGVVNFAIPSGGGEFAVIGPSVLDAVKTIGAGLPQETITQMLSRASLSIAYGESLTNLLQPFYLLLVLPIMGAGTKIQARDVMGYLVIPFVVYFILQSILVVYIPL